MRLFNRIRIGFGALLLTGLSVNLSAQPSNGSQLRFGREEVAEVHDWLIKGAEQKILTAVLSGKLRAFQDSGRIHLWSSAELTNKFRHCETLQIAVDPEGMVLKDTTVCAEPEAELFRVLKRYTSRTADRSLGISYGGIEVPFPAPVVFVSDKDASALLSDDERLVLGKMLNELRPNARLTEYTVREAASDSIFMGVARPFYQAALTGKLKIYVNDSLKSVMTPQQLVERVTFCEVVNIPVDPNDPYYLKDSMICDVFDPNEIAGLAVTEQWVRKGDKGSYQGWSLAPTYRPAIGELIMEPIPIFQAQWKDAMKQFSKGDQAYLSAIVHYIHMRRLDPHAYGVNTRTKTR